VNRPAALVALALVACGPRPPSPTMPTDDIAPARTPYALELTLTADPAAAGRARLRILSRGHEPVTVVVPERPDQILWFDPEKRSLPEPLPRVEWSAWRIDNGGLADESRPSTAQLPSRHATLGPGDHSDAVVELGAALDSLFGPGAFARGWCARAWLVGGAQALASNIVCWPPP
jgi:hypothetical protein